MVKKTNSYLDQDELAYWRKKFRDLSNSARYDEAYSLARKLLKKYPDNLFFAYMEAVMTAEDDIGYSPAQLKARYKSAAKKFRVLLLRTKSMDATLRRSVQNEYYWFSRQPMKQYRLGIKQVKRGDKYSYYSQGVGAAEVAKIYGLKGKVALCHRWARKSEKAWQNYFKVMPNWYNSYLFYAAALGYQGKLTEMEKAYARACKIAKKPKSWVAIKKYRLEVKQVLEAMK
jgi:hypothetical protein